MAASSTSVTCTSAAGRPSAARAARAVACRRRRGTRTRDWRLSSATGIYVAGAQTWPPHSPRPRTPRRPPGFPTPRSTVGGLRRGATAGARLGAVVGAPDHRYQVMAHDVAVAEVDELDTVRPPRHRLRLHQARHAARRQVHLGDVAGDDHLRVEAEPGEEHLHLLGRRVLRLVEDN